MTSPTTPCHSRQSMGPAVACPRVINTDPGCHRTMDTDMALTKAWAQMSPWPQVTVQAIQISTSSPSPPRQPTLRHPHGFPWDPRPWTSASPFVVTQATNNDTDPSCSMTMSPDMALCGRDLGQDLIMAASYLPIFLLSSHEFHLSPQRTNPLALLSLLSLHHKLHLSHSPPHIHSW